MIVLRPNPDEREWREPLGPNAVGFDAKGRLYCDSSNSESESRRDEGELFLCERTGKLYLVYPADAEHSPRRRQVAEASAVAMKSAYAELETRLQVAEAQASATEALLRQALESRDGLVRQNSYLKGRGVRARLFFNAEGRPTKLLRRVLFHTNGKPRGIFRKRVLRAKPGTALHHWLTSPAYLALTRAERPPPQN